MNKSALCTLTRMVEGRREFLLRVVWPTLIGFVSISLFLFLSYMIIEGFSIVQMIESSRDLSEVTVPPADP
jgi:hypothetical protein